MRKISTLAIAAATLFTACSGPEVTVRGDISESGAGKTILLERVLPAGTQVVDSVKADNAGKFEVKITPRDKKQDIPEFYNLRIAEGGMVPLLISKGEKVAVHIADQSAKRYSLEGSPGSSLVWEANRILAMNTARLDSLELAYDRTEDPTQLQEIAKEYAALEVERKQAAIAFLMQHPGSLAAIVPLYQPVKGGDFLFGEVEDVVYFRMVADSLSSRYPQAAYTKSLQSDTRNMENLVGGTNLVLQNLDNEVTFPEIDLPDVLGRKKKLSDLKGNVILLSFTASNVAQFKILNRELVEVYEKYAPKGFEVYQVSLDRNKAEWINGVSEQRLPWISVCDLQGADSPAVTLYNVEKIPTNFLIDREGHIVKRGLASSEIGPAVQALL